MLHQRRRRTKNSVVTVSQCEDAISKWLEDTKPSDPMSAFEFAYQNWTRSVSPPVGHRSRVEKDFRAELRMSRGPRPSEKGLPAMRKRGSIPRGSGTHTSETGLPSLRIGGPVIWMRGHVRPTEQGYTSLGKRTPFVGKGPPLHRKEQPQSRGYGVPGPRKRRSPPPQLG